MDDFGGVGNDPSTTGVSLGSLGGSSSSYGSAADWSSLVSGIYGATQNSKNSTTLNNANAFNSYRPGYAAQLSNLISNPSSVTSDPGFQAGLNQAGDQVQHRLASQGLIGGGTMAGTLSNTAAEYTGTYKKNQETMLANLAGAWINPNQTYASQTNSTSNALGGMSSIFSGLGGIGSSSGGSSFLSGIGSMFGGSSGGDSGGGFMSSIGSLFGG